MLRSATYLAIALVILPATAADASSCGQACRAYRRAGALGGGGPEFRAADADKSAGPTATISMRRW